MAFWIKKTNSKYVGSKNSNRHSVGIQESLWISCKYFFFFYLIGIVRGFFISQEYKQMQHTCHKLLTEVSETNL